MDLEFYQTLWFVLWGVLWAGYLALDGFDLGAGSLLYVLGKSDQERRAIYQSIGPFWDGNEVWLITAGGATFAAFPTAYAVMFSSLYTPLLLLLFALIIRGVAVEYRNKYESPTWRNLWDIAFFVGSLAPALLLGVFFANLFKGIPIDEKGILQTNLLGLLHPYALLGGILFVFCFATHGALWLALRAPEPLASRSASLAKITWAITFVLTGFFLLISGFFTNIWQNFKNYPILSIVPILMICTYLLVPVFIRSAKYLHAWIFSALTIVLFTAWGMIGLFPNLLPSSIDPAYSLTIYNSSSSLLTLKIMTIVAVIFVPVVLLYTYWAYKTFSYRLSKEEVSY